MDDQIPEVTQMRPRLSFKRMLGLFLLALIIIIGLGFLRQRVLAPQVASISGEVIKREAQKVTVPIMIDTAGQTINAAEVFLKFDPAQMKVDSISVDGSIFSIQVKNQPAFSNTTGTISFAGGLPTPGFKGKGKIGSVILSVESPRKVSLTFLTNTQALLNDGLGTAIPLQLSPIEVDIQ